MVPHFSNIFTKELTPSLLLLQPIGATPVHGKKTVKRRIEKVFFPMIY
jgi:hypothetical protein